MSELFLALINKLNSSVFILIAILVLAFIMLFKIGKFFGKWTEKFSHHDGEIGKLISLSEKVLIMQTKVDLIYQHVNPNSPVKSQSPMNLTVAGKAIIDKIHADKIINKYISHLVQEVEKQTPKNAYDIQNISIEVAKNNMLNYLNEDELSAVKQEAYSRGILVEDILLVFGILLRNHILKEKNIPISDVDKHAI